MGVFATRSPFRPNPIGLSCVRLVEICDTEKEGSVLLVEGVDMIADDLLMTTSEVEELLNHQKEA